MAGSVYGVVLNDMAERSALGAAFSSPPYQRPPLAPVLYMKPRNCIASHGGTVVLADDAREVEVAATIGLLFRRDARHLSAAAALDAVGAACLALDVTVPHENYYRPPVRHRARDGFLPLAAFTAFDEAIFSRDMVTSVDGREVHRWNCARLVLPPAELVSRITAFMTLKAGDLLLVGLAGDAPRVGAGVGVRAELDGLAAVEARFAEEALA